MANKIFNLDLTKDTKINSIVLGRVGDGGLQTITVNISNRDVPVDLTGFTITFEGVTNSSQSKIFDSYGVKTETEKLKQGQFDYTFPSAAFSVAGRYETAYFSFQKDENRDTTGKIDIFVSENADIDAGEAETIITEYNKLVQELHEITDKYISDSDAKFADINAKIVNLQAKITQYQNTVKNTADSAVSTINTTKDSAINAVNTSSNAAIKAVEDALKQFEAGDFYTKSETDSKLTDLSSKAVLNKGNLVSGTDLDNIINIGTYRIGALTGGTDVINTPPELSGITIYAYLTVSGTTASVVQELVIYNSRAVSQIYSRSRSGSIPTFSPWSKTLVSDESGKVTVENIEVTGDYKKSTDTEMINLPLSGVATATVSYQRKNGVVFVKGGGNWGNFEANKSRIVGTLPVGFRPPVDWPSGMNAMGGSQSMSASVAADGRVGITCDIKKDGVYGGFSTSFPVE